MRTEVLQLGLSLRLLVRLTKVDEDCGATSAPMDRSSRRSALHKLDPVPERIRNVDPLPARERLILDDLVPSRA
jgi:hypothetical protein